MGGPKHVMLNLNFIDFSVIKVFPIWVLLGDLQDFDLPNLYLDDDQKEWPYPQWKTKSSVS